MCTPLARPMPRHNSTAQTAASDHAPATHPEAQNSRLAASPSRSPHLGDRPRLCAHPSLVPLGSQSPASLDAQKSRLTGTTVPSSDSSTARLTILCIHHGPHSQTPRTFRLHHPFSISRGQSRDIRVHKTPGSRARWTPMNPVWLRGDDSGTTYLCRSTSGFSTGLGEPGVAGMRNGEFPTDPRLGAGENRLAL